MTYKLPRVLIAGPYTGVGKTTFASGLMHSLRKRGLFVQAFKVGPDYIDPSYHQAATGRFARNLDTWMIPRRRILEVVNHACDKVDAAIIEGVMGLYDGAGSGDRASTAEVAKLLQCPVLLVVDAYALARSAGALVLGYQKFDPDLRVAGVILNRVAGAKHARWCTQAIRRHCQVPVLGAIPSKPELALPERHLGLVPVSEQTRDLSSKLAEIGSVIERTCQVSAIWRLMRTAPALPETPGTFFVRAAKGPAVHIGVAIDEAFNFYYRENFELLQCYGAEVVPFSPVHDPEPPSVDGVWIGGGFPEVLPQALEANSSMRNRLHDLASGGMPIYAECGGLMYLTRGIRGYEGRRHSMVGLISAETEMTRELTLAYTRARVVHSNLISTHGWSLRGHEFHFSRLLDVPPDTRFAYELALGRGITDGHDGLLLQNVLASYMHTHFVQQPKMAARFVTACRQYSRR